MPSSSYLLQLLLFFGCLSGYYLSFPALAQITPDTSLGRETSVVTSGVRIKEVLSELIEGGALRGNNLFHSFSDFGISEGQRVYFASPQGIENILTRVTGNNISEIFGTLGVDGAANLFLLNPNGIVFGRDAALDLNGSFFATTGESYIFENGFEYSAVNPEAPPLLTVNIPLGLQMGTYPGDIIVRGGSDRPTSNLSVAPNNTFNLVGGDLILNRASILATDSKINFGSVSDGTVDIEKTHGVWNLKYDRVNQFADIDLNRSSIEIQTLASRGEIKIVGGKISVDRSQIVARNLGTTDGGAIAIQADEAIEIRGVEETFPFSSWIATQVAPEASGNGGAIFINTPQLKIKDGGSIQTISQGKGAAGNIFVDADLIRLSGFAAANAEPEQIQTGQNLSSRIVSTNFAQGNGGNIAVNSDRLTLIDGGRIGTLVAPTATGKGGDLNIAVEGDITAHGVNPYGIYLNSGIASETFGMEDSGTIDVTANNIRFQDGGTIVSWTEGSGNSGDINLQVSGSVTAVGVNPAIPQFTGGIASVAIGSGDGGDINLSTKNLHLQDGNYIASFGFFTLGRSLVATAGKGDLGNVTVNATESLYLIGSSTFNSTLLGSYTLAEGDGGDVNVSAKNLTSRDGAGVSSGVLATAPGVEELGILLPGAGTGKGGNVNLNVDETLLVGGNSPIITNVGQVGTYTFGSGDAGDTVVKTSQLTVVNGGQVISSSRAEGDAGDVSITARNIFLEGKGFDNQPSVIGADASIFNNELLRVRFAVPEASSGGTGIVEIDADSLTIAKGANITAATLSSDGGNISLQLEDSLLIERGGLITAEAGGVGNGGNLKIDSPLITLLNNGNISASSFEGNGGNISIAAQGLFVSADSKISAGSQLGLDGTVNIDTLNSDRPLELKPLPISTIQVAQKITAACAIGNNKFAIVGDGGFPQNAQQYLRGRVIWQDLRMPANETLESTTRLSIPQYPPKPTIIEARDWQINQHGNLELIATASESSERSFGSETYRCS